MKADARSPAPIDLREVRVTEFLQAGSLAANTEKAYRRELKKFLGWTDRPWAEITPRHLAQYKLESLELHQLDIEQIQNLDAFNILLF
uniref:Integrase SAM-like N-terminal domain-containing protein n=1 Tax=Cyanothece sp. (strain PCC 7425 / ATCC 29141) TaxID=395961 RepID=B8HYS0_CYAP4